MAAATTVVALAAGLAFGALVHALPEERFATLVVDDLVQLVAPLLAVVACARTARRVGSHADARLWRWLLAACASWGAGQLVWCGYELVLRVEPPFPSVADVGFLGFPVLAAVGLLRWLARDGQVSASARDLLDGSVTAGALLMVSWQSGLGDVVAATGWSPGLALATAYPLGDVVSATAVLLVLARSGLGRRPWLLPLALGLLSLAVADSAYVYLEAAGGYATGSAVSAGWVTGFLLVAAAAAAVPAAGGQDGAGGGRRLADGLFHLPYVAAGLALAPLGVAAAAGRPTSASASLLAGVLFALVMVRQYLVLRENRSLLVRLRAREAALAHEVMHDALTGLANRAMLLGRLDQLLAQHARDGRGLVLVFCDLDGFKAVNDGHGHLAGDAVLRETATRLRAVLRASDTVARLGGDEFAVLLEPPHEDPLELAARLVAAVARPVPLDSGGLVGGGAGLAPQVSVGVSVGVALVRPGAPARLAAREILVAADTAMYSAKSGTRQAGADRAENRTENRAENRAVLVEIDEDRTGRVDGLAPAAR
ncbi:diguanylate cyclase domain-containing protein [Aquipuribacter nitratireducens]|uniref:Diguanylate cyclase domain-containing protein n=1 Tax=Aquipuribacter nitratireducens TaxID=650104 RepID=A0ABW0GLG9_9MICO